MRTPLQALPERIRSRLLLQTIGAHGSGCFIGRHSLIEHGEHMTFGERVLIGPFSRIGTVPDHFGQVLTPRLVIATGVSMEWFCHISCAGSLRIGRDTLMAASVYITDHDHGLRDPSEWALPPAVRRLEVASVSVGERCWLGERTCILAGAAVGDDCVIGAGSVVTGEIPSGSIAVGSPARVIRRRSSAGWSPSLPPDDLAG